MSAEIMLTDRMQTPKTNRSLVDMVMPSSLKIISTVKNITVNSKDIPKDINIIRFIKITLTQNVFL